MKSFTLSQYFSVPLYVRVERNRVHVRHAETGREVTVVASPAFTTTRLLVGEFSAAESNLCAAIQQLVRNRWWMPSPSVVIHPLEMTEGGLSKVEERIFHELAVAAGAAKVLVWVGAPLSDQEVMQKLA
jgi:hypothetical protein